MDPARHSVDYLYSLYDALVSINVPSDKARAVVDAMERDMGTTLATKQDLQLLATATKQDLALMRQELRQELHLLKQELFGVQRELKQDIENRSALLAHEISTQTLRMTVRLGSMLVVGLGLTIAILRLWSS
ncbi:MAG: hypothetical protein ACREQZ_04610 [Woeseiaceae bacterium]